MLIALTRAVLSGGEEIGKSGNLLRRMPIFPRLQLIGWGGYAICDLFSRISFWGGFPVAFTLTLLVEPVTVLITFGLRWVYRRRGIREAFDGQAVWTIAAISGVAAVVHLGWVELMLMMIRRFGLVAQGDARYLPRLIFFWILFSGWSFAYLWLRAELEKRSEQSRRKAAVLAAEKAELQMLRYQLNPHFLFNSLNQLVTEINDRPDVALEMTHRLAEYLRHSLDYRGELLVPLSLEIQSVKDYLAIEQGRFEDRLSVLIDTDFEARNAMVPSFLLQPLVENAVKHGLKTSAPPWKVSVKSSKGDDQLTIVVRNSGCLESQPRTQPRAGVGLENLKRRLQIHYPERHCFRLYEDAGMVVAELNLEGAPC
ncbi:histidine kinase [Luteolibacter pohnpeiensis]|uniref:Histidine kinase n=1 Tax=Luteolibacter pohnpeiensis TaxID=454153 RepID=A0A934VPT5_9BACT|nr:histidine kinase [Luteolibacter pohnpeiensis]MBK1881376.1 histidine kinase [Luteolibacter pohnpeiensis]